MLPCHFLSTVGSGTEGRTSDITSENVKGHTFSHSFSHQPSPEGANIAEKGVAV